MSSGTLFFMVCSVTCVAGALFTVMAKNPVRGAVGLLATIAGIAGLFLKLSAQFLAAIQLIVYAGAVVVLFVFVIMLLGPDAGGGGRPSKRSRLAKITSGVLLVSMGGAMILMLTPEGGSVTRFGPVTPEHGSVEAVGGMLFSAGIVPFELTTALLIVAVVGAIAVARGKQGVRKRRRQVTDPRDLFGGPVHPRDAGRPLKTEAPR